MKEFISKHPVVSLFALAILADGAVKATNNLYTFILKLCKREQNVRAFAVSFDEPEQENKVEEEQPEENKEAE